MTRTRPARALLPVLLAALSLAMPDAVAWGATPSDLYVGKYNPSCSDSGPGSQAQPYCTISAAAAVVAAGVTVHVGGGDYAEHVTIAASGTTDSPIVFIAVSGAFPRLTGDGAGITITGQHDISIAGLPVYPYPGTGAGITVSDASHITLTGDSVYDSGPGAGLHLTGVTDSVVDKGWFRMNAGPGIVLDGGTTGVTIRGVFVDQNGYQSSTLSDGIDVLSSGNSVIDSSIGGSSGAGVVIGAGVAGTTVANDFVVRNTGEGIDNAGATDTTVSNNTVTNNCAAGIRVRGTSSGVSVQNNIAEGNGEYARNCPSSLSDRVDIGVYDDAVADTVVDYNIVHLVDTTGTGAADPYAWGTPLSSLSAFQAASGQGPHDMDVDPMLSTGAMLMANSPAIDSANSAAPGVQAVDAAGTAPLDIADVPNTGAGSLNYLDRGWKEYVAPPIAKLTITSSQGSLANGWTVTADASASTAGSYPLAGYTFDFHDGSSPVTQSTPVATHVYHHAGSFVVTVTVADTGDHSTSVTSGVDLGSLFVPLGPVRVIDTRHGIGTATTTPVAAGATVSLLVAGIGGLPKGVTAVVVNVTVTEPTSSGWLTIYPDGRSRPLASSLNWTAGQTIANLVTVPVVDGKVDFYNSGPGTVHVIADLAGYYSGAVGSTYASAGPVRVLDTRHAVGVDTMTPVAAGDMVSLNVAGVGSVPATGVTAVVLNVTVTGPTSSGWLTVYPDGRSRPLASSLNWAAGQTIPNLVTVPVVDGKVDFYNSGPGTVHVIADLAGYFS